MRKLARKTKSEPSIDPRRIPDINIGMVGHVDHGKTTLTQALSGKWTDTHSEEIKRGITIRIGYADVPIYKCPKCKEYPYSTTEVCPKCFSKCDLIRTVSIVDVPGHESLMATVLSASVLMDYAILVIAANEKCPQPQTEEHLMALQAIGIKDIIIVQNKIDIVSEQRAMENYREIKEFVKGTIAENAPIIPVSAQNNINIDVLLEEIEKRFKPIKRDRNAEPLFVVARSFDINKPGTKPSKLKGGILGGSVVQGVLRKGDEITIRPGIQENGKWVELKTMVKSLHQGGVEVEEATPGGLVGVMTGLDPYVTKSDRLSGNLAGKNLPPVMDELKLKVHFLNRRLIKKGTMADLQKGQIVMVTAGVAKSVGVVTESKNGKITLKLKIPVCAKPDWKVSLSIQLNNRWRLIGWGEII